MVLVKHELDNSGKPFVAIWYEGDIVCVMDDWLEVSEFVRSLLEEAATAWPHRSQVIVSRRNNPGL